jgi:hypothetical protein
MTRLAAFLLACSLATPALALPTEIEAEYRVSLAGLTVGRVVESFGRSGDTYRIASTSRSEGALKAVYDETAVLRSEGRVGAGGLQPHRFEYRRATDPGRDVLALFDWDKAEIRTEYRGEETTHALPPGTQDRISVLYQFMFMAPSGADVRMHMSNGRKVELYAYRKVDEPRIATPAGEFETAHYERVRENAKESRTEVWLARDRFNFPVRVLFEDSRGFVIEQTLVSLTMR